MVSTSGKHRALLQGIANVRVTAWKIEVSFSTELDPGTLKSPFGSAIHIEDQVVAKFRADIPFFIDRFCEF